MQTFLNQCDKKKFRNVCTYFIKIGIMALLSTVKWYNDTQHSDITKFSMMTLAINDIQHDSHYGECRISFIVTLNVVMLSVVTLGVVAPVEQHSL